jgi:hypothetical protein
MTKMQDRIEQLQREIQILKDAITETDNQTIRTVYEEDIENKETEIIKILDGDIIVDEAEYQEHMAEVINNQRELENSQK